MNVRMLTAIATGACAALVISAYAFVQTALDHVYTGRVSGMKCVPQTQAESPNTLNFISCGGFLD